ncbi:hypothetical protein [Serratia marcescens]|uniref:hypothetical protein n=1 Tax=Serratia marcescens TaxID=615 RepID=UPI001F14BB2A|nr:hypothetical protein [Serratia marcescens]
MTTIKRFTPDYKMHAVRFEAFAREAEHGELVRFDAHQQVVSAIEAERDAQQKRADALAVESVELRHIAERIVNALYAAGYEPEENSLHPWKSLIFDAEKALNTPATDAAFAAIQAQGVEKFADELHKTAMALCPVKPDNTTTGAYAGLARSFAKKLREAK